MKILFVVHDYWPKFNAGVENHVHYLAEALSKKNEVFIFTTEPYSQDEEHEIYFEKKVKVIKIHSIDTPPKSAQETYLNSNFDEAFKKYLDEIKPDVVHIQHLIRLSLNFTEIVKEKKIPLVYTLHDLWFECPLIRRYKNKQNCQITNKNLGDCNNCLDSIIQAREKIHAAEESSFKRKIKNYPKIFNFLKSIKNTAVFKVFFAVSQKIKTMNFLAKGHSMAEEKSLIEIRWDIFKEHFKKVDIFISPSKFLAEEAHNFGIEKNKLVVIPHGIPGVEKNFKIIKSIYTKNSKINFGFTSHITEDKGFYLLTSEFKKLLKKYKNIQLSVYGSYDKKDKDIKKVLAGLNPPISYRGVYDSKDTGKILSKIDVLVVPSLWNEIYGLVVDEALLYKTPVIISNRGGMPERVENEKTGFIFNPDVKNSLYSKLERIAKNPIILNNIQKNLSGVKSIESYSFEIEKIYKKLLDIK
jgi:glycosyltransferase involved in cell wall biosynthesis